MNTYIRPAVVMMLLFSALTGLVYPLAITAATQSLLAGKANGTLVIFDGQAIGSELIGQRFTSDRYFHGRPSAAGQDGYDAMASSGSNLGPLSKKLLDRVEADVVTLRKGIPERAAIPADAVTASGSGLDPHITPEFAELQVERVAKALGVSPSVVRDVVRRETEQPSFGFIGEPRVNVLRLNAALQAKINAGAGPSG